MGSWWQMYAANLEENTPVPLMEAGQRGENVTEEPWGKREIFPQPIDCLAASFMLCKMENDL